MNKCLMFLLLPILFVCTGCTTYWYQDGKTFQECRQARDECRAELMKRSDLSNSTFKYEAEFMKNCMIEKGYNSVKQGNLPLDAKRQEAEISFHWRTKGIAGTLDK